MKKTSIDIKHGIGKLVAERLNFSEEMVELTNSGVPFGYECQDIVYQYLAKESPRNDEKWVIHWLDMNYKPIIEKYGSLQNFYDKSYSQSCIEVLREIISELKKGKYTFKLINNK